MRQTRYGYPSRVVAVPESRISIFDPTLGFDGGAAPSDLLPGYSPACQNWVYEDGCITRRPGLSRHWNPNSDVGNTPVLGGVEYFDVAGNRHAIAATMDGTSGGTFPRNGYLYLAPFASDWTHTSWSCYTTDATETATQTPNSVVASKGIGSASFYEPASDERWAVFTTDLNLPKFLTTRTPSGTTTGNGGLWFSDFSCVASQFSHARAVVEFDYRLIWFHVASQTTDYPNRVVWSVRGNPLDYTIANGAGFEDLLDMRGDGVRVIAEQDSIVLFTSQEIWRGRNRRDPYVFDFYAINRQLGTPFFRTIVSTPFGIVFLAMDFELYILNGDQCVPLGPVNGHSRIQGLLRRSMKYGELAHAIYNTQERRYELYYTAVEDGSIYPQRGLFYQFDNQAFFPQVYAKSLSHSMEVLHEDAPTWDQLTVNWNDYPATWDNTLNVDIRRPVLFSWMTDISGFDYAWPLSSYTSTTWDETPSVSTIDLRWRSHGLGGADAARYDQLYEVRCDLTLNQNIAVSPSTISMWVSGNGGATFSDPFAAAVSASSYTQLLFPCSITAQAPQFELRNYDIQMTGRPMLARLQAKLRDSGAFTD